MIGFVVHTQNLLADRVSPAGEESGFHGRSPLLGAQNSRDVHTFFAKVSTSQSPASSSPTAVIGNTLAPRATKLLAALAPPPGTICVSRCRRINTGASRETRLISPD